MPKLEKIESEPAATPPAGSVILFWAAGPVLKAKKSDGTVVTVLG